ncbi:hypothetical protein [Mucilaginibacter sp. NFR10]|uniref:hypothetical protein n=1 Tax=Mucilaginibacter sp. NFR10 TaxID=1566292 RepID=UPI000B839FA9|nr:hypothetical protein [Mucilaginibacter sp. NFR10]
MEIVKCYNKVAVQIVFTHNRIKTDVTLPVEAWRASLYERVSDKLPMTCLKNTFLSAGKLRAKTGRTMVALSEGKGIASFCRSWGYVWAKRGKIIAAVVLTVLQGKGRAMDIGAG